MKITRAEAFYNLIEIDVDTDHKDKYLHLSVLVGGGLGLVNVAMQWRYLSQWHSITEDAGDLGELAVRQIFKLLGVELSSLAMHHNPPSSNFTFYIR